MKTLSLFTLGLFLLLLSITSVSAKTFTITQIEVVPAKVNEKMIEMQRKSFHGKVLKKTEKRIINKKPAKGNPAVDAYIKLIQETITKQFRANQHVKKKKLKGKVLAKIQIQKNGLYDILFIGGEHVELSSLTQEIFDRIAKFPKIPMATGQQEIQLKIPLEYNFQ